MIDPTVVAALIAAFASLVVAILSYFTTKKNQDDVEILKAKLQEQNAEKDARRDYEYEARKRLYHEYEPLFFQLVELSEVALNRIYNLARLARLGKLLDKDGLSCDVYSIAKQSSMGKLRPLEVKERANEVYYATSIIYYLLSPLVEAKLIQRLLTFVDLSLDQQINEQYILTKLLYKSFNADFDLAGTEPKLEYDPDNSEWAEKRKIQPKIYWRQGVVAGDLEVAVNSLIVRDPDNNIIRCMNYSEFEDAFYKKKSDLYEKVSSFANLFLDFHPKTRPVLWRILVTQAHIYKALLYARELQKSGSVDTSIESIKDIPLRTIPQEDRLEYEWRQRPDEASNEEVLIQPFEVAHAYLQSYLTKFNYNGHQKLNASR